MSSHPSQPLDVRLQIVKQESVTQDVSFANGQTKVVHSCIKGSPFKLELALVGHFDRSLVNFNRFVITAVLIYDASGDNAAGLGAGEERQVSFVKTRPLEVLEYGVNETGDRLTLLVVLNVLSSQHEHSLFVIKIANADLGLVAFSQPIRVVSKELQLKAKKDKPRGTKAPAGPGAAPARRPLTEDVLATLKRIEGQGQTDHQLLLTILDRLALQQQQRDGETEHTGERRPSVSELPGEAAKRQKVTTISITDQDGHPAALSHARQLKFEAHFDNLVRAFAALPREQRTETVRRAVRECPDRDSVYELLGHLAAAGMMGNLGIFGLNNGLLSAAFTNNSTNNGGPVAVPPAPLSSLPQQRPIKAEPPDGSRQPYTGPSVPLQSATQQQERARPPSFPEPPAEFGGADGMNNGTEQPSLGMSGDLDSNKFYNDLLGSWPYESLNLSQ